MSNLIHLVKDCKSGNKLSLTGRVITLFSKNGEVIRRNIFSDNMEARKQFYLIVGV